MSETDKIIGNRIKALRESLQLSQAKTAKMFGGIQPSLYRYETGRVSVPHHVLLWYADYFDVSLDYLYGRTDSPQGKLYSYEPEAIRKKYKDSKEMEAFVEMCFDPNSSANAMLKETILKMMKEK